MGEAMKDEMAPTERNSSTLDSEPISWNATAQMMMTPMMIQMLKNVVRMTRSARSVSCFIAPLIYGRHAQPCVPAGGINRS